MSNPLNPRPLERLLKEFQDKGFSREAQIAMREMFTRLDKTLTNLGEVQSVAPIKGRTEGVGTTVGNLDAGGIVLAPGVDFVRAYTNKNVGNVPETNALKYRTAAHSAASPQNLTITSTDSGGGHASINVSGFTELVPGLTGFAVNPLLVIGLNNSTTYYIYHDDSTFAGGNVSSQVTTDPTLLFQNGARFYDGFVTTPAGGGGPSTGKPGGQGGGVNRTTVLA